MSRSRSVSSACSIKFRASQSCGIKTMGRVPRLALERGIIRVNQNTIYRTALRAQKSAKAQLCTLRSKIGNLIHRRAAFLAVIWSLHRMQPVIWSLHRMQPVIWSHHRIQRLDRLNGSPGSRAAASSFFGAGGDFKMKSRVADRGLVGSNMGRFVFNGARLIAWIFPIIAGTIVSTLGGVANAALIM